MKECCKSVLSKENNQFQNSSQKWYICTDIHTELYTLSQIHFAFRGINNASDNSKNYKAIYLLDSKCELMNMNDKFSQNKSLTLFWWEAGKYLSRFRNFQEGGEFCCTEYCHFEMKSGHWVAEDLKCKKGWIFQEW